MRKVLSTKTLDKATLALAESLYLDVQCLDFIKISRIEFNTRSLAINSFDSVAFTSPNAVKYFLWHKSALKLLMTKTIFALGGKTADDLRKQDLSVTGFGENAEELARDIIRSKRSNSVLHVCGNLKSDAMEKLLREGGISYTPLIVYHTLKEKKLLLNNDFDAVMFYSPSGVESFFIDNELSAKTCSCCIGKTTAAALRMKHPSIKIIFPEQPSPGAMLEAIASAYPLTT